MEFSIDQGENWSILGSYNDPNWYNSSRISGDGINNNCYNCVGGQWTGTQTEIQEYSYNLSTISNNDNIIFRFVFHTDEYVNEEGIIIDDLVIEGTVLSTNDFESKSVTVYPNPSKNVFNISLDNVSKFNLILHDITGKVLFNEVNINNVNNNFTLDLNNFSNGIYLLKVVTKDRIYTKKLILKK
jgi:hypothetical protein